MFRNRKGLASNVMLNGQIIVLDWSIVNPILDGVQANPKLGKNREVAKNFPKQQKELVSS